MKHLISSVILVCIVSQAFCQLKGHQKYEQLGLAFDIPEGWVGQEGDGNILLGSNSISGFILISTHQYSIQELMEEARNGITEEGGTALKLSGNIHEYEKNAIGGLFKGTLEWQPAQAYVIGVSNSKGFGVTIMAATTKEQYTVSHKNACEEIYHSLAFSEIDLKKNLNEWKEWLSDVRLTYMNSYYSSSYTSGGLSGGSSTKKTIDLCKKGYFNFSGSSSATISGSNASLLNHGENQGQGNWTLSIGNEGNILLQLAFNDGSESVYEVTYQEDKLFLNGTRYFRTTDGEYAPNCN